MAWTFGCFLALGRLYMFTQNNWLGRLLKLLLWPLWIVTYRVFTGITAAIMAIVMSGVSLPLSLGTWLAALQSDRRRKIRDRLDVERAERNLATGAAITPIRAA